MTAAGTLPANATHGPGRLDKVRLANMVAGLLLPDNGTQKILHRAVGGAAPQQRPQIVLGHAEEAGADFAVGGQADAVAMAAERFADRGDDADFAAPVRAKPSAWRSRRGCAKPRVASAKRWRSRARISRPGTTISLCQARAESSGMNSMKRRAQALVGANSASASISWSLMPRIMTALTLTGCKPSSCARLMPARTACKPVAPGDLLEIVAVQRIEAEADAAQARLAQGPALFGEEKPVGGHGQVAHAGNGGDQCDQVFECPGAGAVRRRSGALFRCPGRRRGARRARFPRRSGLVVGLPLAR